ncbi:MAG: 50S ribosomal protein L22 [Mollicutes bacterium]|jgi:large subunit ribosomal protein L22|nr:50S ribosomal protein L22 [Mollicutes bacterium]
MEAKAIAKGVRIAPRKARLVIDLVRGKKVDEADHILSNLNKEAARIIRKVLISAVANAENNLGLNKENLYIKEAIVNEGQTLKRIRFGSRGHIDPIKRRTSHIMIVVSERN